MNAAIRVPRELVHLFIEDASLSILIISTVLISAVVAHFAPARSLISGIVLLAGCLIALLANVLASSGRA
jgi:hypothetical protein